MQQDRQSEVYCSFRDPAGSVYREGGVFYRRIHTAYKDDYDCLMRCGLYETLLNSGMLMPHHEVNVLNEQDFTYKTIQPDNLTFVSYPYEWCFGQLKDAALTLLKIQQTTLRFGMTLKDACADNVQFKDSRPILIDTLSFQRYKEGEPWVAYRQFCQHFLAPLALMAYSDVHLNQLLRIFQDGIPLDVASRLLPLRTRLRFGLLSHIHLHARVQRHYQNRCPQPRTLRLKHLAFNALIDNLISIIHRLHWKAYPSAWSSYYTKTIYTPVALSDKERIISEWIEQVKPRLVFDFGANTGLFSRLCSGKGIETVAFDSDYAVVQQHYQACVRENRKHILPLVMDLTNPSPGTGWANRERMSLAERGPADLGLILSLIHHLAIPHRIPFRLIAQYLSQLCKAAVVEFIPPYDPQAKHIIATGYSLPQWYTQQVFEEEFSEFFSIRKAMPVADSDRRAYLLLKK